MTMMMSKVKYYNKFSTNECINNKKKLFICEIRIYIYEIKRAKHREVANVLKRVAKFNYMHVPGRCQNIFLADVFGKASC